MVNWYLGTMGFSWKDWKGVFYPTYLGSGDYLAYYSRVFNSVEIDSTFYGIPKPEVVTKWAASTADNFVISAKMPKAITHEMELVGVDPLLDEFLETIRNLRSKLGVILVQFRPGFTVEKLPELQAFLKLLPRDIRFAVEFRHRSWYNDKTAALLEEHGFAWAATEYQHLPKRIYRTASFLYVRFIGYHGRFEVRNKEQLDVTGQLEWWRDHIGEHLDSVDSVFGYFNNDYSGFAAGTVNRFRGMVGLEVKDLAPPDQEKLF